MSVDSKNETLKISGAGFARTGTTSLTEALDILGFRCYNMHEVIKHHKNTHPNLWIKAFEGNLTDYDLIFDSKPEEVKPYTATVFWPSIAVWKDLMEKYPSAKIILTLRDGESWYKSMRNTIYRIVTEFPIRVIVPKALQSMVWKLIWTGTFNNRFEDKEYAIDVYNKHNERVQQIVPKDRLLVLDLTKNGRWDELCQFLEVPVPDVSFPRSNERKYIKKGVDRMNRIGWIIISGVSVLVAFLGVRLYYVMK